MMMPIAVEVIDKLKEGKEKYENEATQQPSKEQNEILSRADQLGSYKSFTENCLDPKVIRWRSAN